MQAPFRPEMKSRFDTGNFDPEFANVTPALTPVYSGLLSFIARVVGLILTRKVVLSEAMQEKFQGFSTIGTTAPVRINRLAGSFDGLRLNLETAHFS